MKCILQKNNSRLFSFVLIGLANILNIFGQSNYEHHAKYWYYRTRLRNDFMLVGKGQGMSIPMEERGYYYQPYKTSPTNPYNYDFTPNNNNPINDPTDGQSAKWGDAMSELGYYIGVLATEYELLRSNGQSTDSTLKEIYYALYALNRIDKNAEVLWNNINGTFQISNPCNTDGIGCLDGFMVRDDVDRDFVANNYAHFNYNVNGGFCSNIKINNQVNAGEGGTTPTNQSCWSVATYETNHPKESNFISQDNYYNVLLGLVLVRKFLSQPSNQTYLGKSFQDGETSLWKESLNIALRVFDYFVNRRSSGGHILYPNGATIGDDDGGYVAVYSFAHSEALGKMRDNYYGWPYVNPTEGQYAFHDRCDRHSYLHTGSFWQDAWNNTGGIIGRGIGYITNPHSVSQLQYTALQHEIDWKWSADAFSGSFSNTNDKNVMTANLTAICNCRYSFVSNITGEKMQITEYSHDAIARPRNLYHEQLIRIALNGYASCNYGESNPFPSSDFSNVSALLDAAPCSGPYAYKSTYGPGPGPQDPNGEWYTTSRVDWPDRRNRASTPPPGEYNGIDYMLYHNLYYLTRRYVTNDYSNGFLNHENELVDFSNRYLTLSYPILGNTNTSSSNPWGSVNNPATVGAFEVINATCKVNSNAVVTMKAGKEVQLLPGFSAVSGSDFAANIERLTCTSILNQDNAYDNINARTVTNGSSKDTSSHYYYASLPTKTDSSIIKNNLAQNNTPKKNEVAKPKQIFTSVKNNSTTLLAENIAIYPNPNSGIFSLAINTPSIVKSIEIQNTLGETVFETKNNILNENTIDISSLQPGVYMLKIFDVVNKVCTKKVIKN